jgi:hypothetical protein
MAPVRGVIQDPLAILWGRVEKRAPADTDDELREYATMLAGLGDNALRFRAEDILNKLKDRS